MLKSHPQMETIHRSDGPSREFSRIPVVIPVRVEILPASKGGVFAAVPGVLLNIGCGGGKVRVRWVNPLSVGALQAVLLGQGLTRPGEMAHAPRV